MWDNFKLKDFTCKCGCGYNLMEPTFIDKLQWLRSETGIVMPVTSGYRCAQYNAKVSTTGLTGPHTTGRAADISVRGQDALKLLNAALSGDKFTGIGINQKGAARFLHFDDLMAPYPRPAIWTY